MIETSSQYHQQTSYDRRKMSGHHLDWQNQPLVFKEYPGVEPILLPRDVHPPDVNLSALCRGKDPAADKRGMDIDRLSLILQLTYSLTAGARHQGGEFYYRSAASAGALYPTEIYVSASGVSGLDNGLYHFAIHHHGLCRLREGNFWRHISDIKDMPQSDAHSLTLFFTAIFFRSAWKYRERAYRYHLMDTGHVVENLILALKALRFPCHLSYDFDDRLMNDFLGLDESKEVSLAVVQVTGKSDNSDHGSLPVKKLPEEVLTASKVSGHEVHYPAIQEIHRAGTWTGARAVQDSEMIQELGVLPGSWKEMSRSSEWPETMNYAETVLHRRSKRNFVKRPIPRDALLGLIEALCPPDASASTPRSGYERSLCTGFLLGGTEGISPGFYLLDRVEGSFGQVASGSFMDQMARISLDQAWLAQAAVHFLFLTNLTALDETWGPRGYRYAMMTAGRLGERLYMAATAMGMGCCGIGAFYDEEAAELLGLKGSARLLYLVAVGPVKRV